MEVTDDCSNAGEVMRIESQGGRAPLCWNGGMGLGAKGESPELGTSGFLPTTEDDRVILGKYSDGYFLEEDTAVVVAQFTNAHQIVMEVGHYMDSIDEELLDDQVT